MKKPVYLLLFLVLTALAGCTISETGIAYFENPAPENSLYPYLYSNGSQLYMSWITRHSKENVSLNYAVYSGHRWDDVHTIARDSSWFVNWADFPSIIAGPRYPLAAHWLNKIPGGTYAYNVNISMYSDSGWSAPLTPHFDRTATEHGFVSMVPWNGDTVLAVWLDGRRSAHRSEREYYNLDLAMTLRGALISASGEVLESFLIDDSVCDCCQTSLIKTSEGAIVAYRNRTEEEIRDIYISRFNGSEWSKPEAVFNDEWEIGACPVNGPKLANEDSTVIVAWYTAAKGVPAVKASVSRNGGSTFGNPYTVSQKETLGRVDAAVYEGKVYISWLQKGDDDTRLMITQPGFGEGRQKTISVARIEDSRKTGFPQLEVFNNHLILAWTDPGETADRIKTLKIPLPLTAEKDQRSAGSF